MSRQISLERNTFRLGVIAHDLDREADERMGVAQLRTEVELAARDAGEVEQVVDEACFERDVAFHHSELVAGVGREAFVRAQRSGRHEDRGERRA